ncbi:Ribonuclease H-like domain [Trinorchestia longiramus]|nr:Ribonuclease H-like domain [Trinorchestia longiramus]
MSRHLGPPAVDVCVFSFPRSRSSTPENRPLQLRRECRKISKLEYGWPAWGILRSSSLKKLTVIQNPALRNVLGVKKTSPVLSLEVESRRPPLELRLQLLTARWYIRLMNRGNHDYTLKQLELARRGQQTVFEIQVRQVLVPMKAPIPRRVRTGTLSPVPPWSNFPSFISVDAPCRTAYHGQETANEAMMQEDLNAKYSGFTQIFTDGSKLLSGSTAASLFVPSLAQAVGWKINPAHTVLGAELFGIHQALTFANKHPALHNKDIVIPSDSQSALHLLKNIWNPNYRHIVYDIQKLASQRQQVSKVCFQWFNLKNVLGGGESSYRVQLCIIRVLAQFLSTMGRLEDL